MIFGNRIESILSTWQYHMSCFRVISSNTVILFIHFFCHVLIRFSPCSILPIYNGRCFITLSFLRMQYNALVLSNGPISTAQCPVIDIVCSIHQLDWDVNNQRLRNKEAWGWPPVDRNPGPRVQKTRRFLRLLGRWEMIFKSTSIRIRR